MRRFLSWALLLPLVIVPLAARAQAENATEPEGYRQAVEDALAEYGYRNFEEASSLFARAHGIFPNARTLRGMGMAAFELRRYEESASQLEAALACEVKPLEGELRAQTDALVARAHGFVARVRLSVAPEQAALFLDGAAIPKPQRGALLVRLGEHVLEAQAPGYGAQRRTLRVRGGEELRVELALQREPLLPGPDEQPVSTRERPPRLYKNPWLWSAVGAVVVAAVATGVALSRRPHSDPSDALPPAGSVPGRVASMSAR